MLSFDEKSISNVHTTQQYHRLLEGAQPIYDVVLLKKSFGRSSPLTVEKMTTFGIYSEMG